MEIQIVHVIVKEPLRCIFTNFMEHDVIGIVWVEDEEHIWVKTFRQSIVNFKSHMSIPIRYPKDMIDIEYINDLYYHHNKEN